jgi:spermidine/putrescine transport system substrate-binding protein
MNWKITAAAIGVALLASTSLASAEGELQIYNWGTTPAPR